MRGTNLPPFTFMTPTKRLHKRGAGPSEYQIHLAVVAHLLQRAKPDVDWWHTPNGGKRGKIEAARLKRMGVKRGVADLILVYQGDNFALELKTETGRETIEQMKWRERMKAQGWHTCVCHGLDRALKTLETWGLLR